MFSQIQHFQRRGLAFKGWPRESVIVTDLNKFSSAKSHEAVAFWLLRDHTEVLLFENYSQGLSVHPYQTHPNHAKDQLMQSQLPTASRRARGSILGGVALLLFTYYSSFLSVVSKGPKLSPLSR